MNVSTHWTNHNGLEFFLEGRVHHDDPHEVKIDRITLASGEDKRPFDKRCFTLGELDSMHDALFAALPQALADTAWDDAEARSDGDRNDNSR